MFIQDVLRRLNEIEMLPELREGLQQMTIFDAPRIAKNTHLGVIQSLQHILGLNPDYVAPFDAAWSLMYAAISRLDHLQDGDPVENDLPTTNQQSAQYNLLFGYYLLAASLLDMLSLQSIPSHRISRIRHLWSDLMLRMASGQQRDIITKYQINSEISLEYYQGIAQAKTGASFALAFGGAATLYTDDENVINAFILVGELYGTILQYSDDVKDELEQSNLDITLPRVLKLNKHSNNAKEYTTIDFLIHINRLYREVAAYELKIIPAPIQEAVLQLFDKLLLSK